jgi:Cu/Ag efflux pump CusA
MIAARLSGGVLSLGSLVGFLTLMGIAARNGILLINHCQHLEQFEGMPFGPALVLRGAAERLFIVPSPYLRFAKSRPARERGPRQPLPLTAV